MPATTAWMYSCNDAYCAVAGVGVVRCVAQDLVVRHRHDGEHRGARAGAALTEAVPVVDQPHTGLDPG